MKSGSRLWFYAGHIHVVGASLYRNRRVWLFIEILVRIGMGLLKFNQKVSLLCLGEMRMIETIFSSFYSIIGAILIAAFAAWLAYRNGRKVRRATACAVFRNAISTSLQGLYPIPVDWPDSATGIRHILNRQFPVIQTAVNEFRNYVPWYNRRKFDKAWRRYRNAYEEDESAECYHHYESFDGNSDHKTLFKVNVDRLMSFAKDV